MGSNKSIIIGTIAERRKISSNAKHDCFAFDIVQNSSAMVDETNTITNNIRK